MTKRTAIKVRSEAKTWSILLIITSLGMIFLSWRIPNNGILILYSVVSIIIVGIHTWRSYSVGVKIEKLIYLIGLMIVVILFFASLSQFR